MSKTLGHRVLQDAVAETFTDFYQISCTIFQVFIILISVKSSEKVLKIMHEA